MTWGPSFFKAAFQSRKDWLTARGQASRPSWSGTLKVGTDCSGMEAPLYALQAMQQPYCHMWSSDRAKEAQAFIQQNHAPKSFFDDVTKRKPGSLVSLADDGLYVAGFPCQSYSFLGARRGLADVDRAQALQLGLQPASWVATHGIVGRLLKGPCGVCMCMCVCALLRMSVLDTVKATQPVVALLENVMGCLTHLPALLALMTERFGDQYHIVVASWLQSGVPCVVVRRGAFLY